MLNKTTVRQTVVTTQVKINFPRSEVDHIIRCWVDQNMTEAARPKPKDFSDIAVTAIVSADNDLIGYEAIYQPAHEVDT